MPRDGRVFPALLRHWRSRRGLSQLDLALAADVSARHVSFLETGRAQPSREMVLRLATALNVPLRDQNAMLNAAGFADAYEQGDLAAVPPAIEQAIERMLALQEPYPMAILDRHYDVVRANPAAGNVFSRFVADPGALPEPLNAFALMFDPRLCRPFVLEWERTARAMLARVHRESLSRPEDSSLASLVQGLFAYPGVPEEWRQPDFALPSEPTLAVRFRREDLEVGFLTTVTVFSAPQNVTLEELRIESYFPLDEATRRSCQKLAAEALDPSR